MLVAVVLAGLRAVSQLYMPSRISSVSSVYGAFGVAAAVVGWFFIVGRTLAIAFSLNAVVYEQWGSTSTFAFGLPGMRSIPRRFPPVARFFDLEGRRTPSGRRERSDG